MNEFDILENRLELFSITIFQKCMKIRKKIKFSEDK